MRNIFNSIHSILVHRKSLEAIKGYRTLRKSDPDFVNRVRNTIADNPLNIRRSIVENILFPKEVDLSIATHQYLLKILLGRMFTRSVLSCIHTRKSFLYPLPSSWLKIVDDSGIKVAYFRSRILFLIFISIYWLFAIFTLFRNILLQFKRREIKGDYSYFFDLDNSCLPSIKHNNTYNIVDWYIKNFKRGKKTIVHNVYNMNIDDRDFFGFNIRYSIDHCPKINYFDFFVKFLPVTFLQIFFLTFVNLVLLRWWNILLLKEMVYMNIFKYLDSNKSNQYFFHFSYRIYRPLWTYVAQMRGSELIFYFYSCHISTYMMNNGEYSTVPEFWQVMNWPTYLVWNKSHAKFIQSQIQSPANIKIVHPIYYQESSSTKLTTNRPIVLVFDMQPYREYFSYTFASAQSYTYSHKVSIAFLKDIQEVTSQMGVDLLFKRKRNESKLNKKYLTFLKSFVENDNVTEIDPGVSAFRLCKECDVTISMPFTSTAVVADYYGKESIYYDPTGNIQKNDRAAHNLTVINGKKELRGYLNNLIKNTIKSSS